MDLLPSSCFPTPTTISSSVSSIETTANDCSIFNQDAAQHLYQKKNIVFFGDGTTRSIYCDLSRLLHKGNMLNNKEIKKHHSHHAIFVNETIFEIVRKCPVSQRIDCRRFVCKHSSTVLYFIHLGTILDKECPINISWLREITQGSPIDLVVMSCANPDLCHRILEKNNEQFDEKLKRFQSKLIEICSIFKLAFFDSIFIWLSPFPTKSLNDQQMKQMEELIQICFDITCGKYLFECFISPQNWMKYYQQIFVKDEDYYISNEGVRRLTTEISELMKKKWNEETPNKCVELELRVEK